MRRQALKFLVLQERLLRRQRQNVVTVVQIAYREGLVRLMHDFMGIWDARMTIRMFMDDIVGRRSDLMSFDM